jgi:hypothetical protein
MSGTEEYRPLSAFRLLQIKFTQPITAQPERLIFFCFPFLQVFLYDTGTHLAEGVVLSLEIRRVDFALLKLQPEAS